MLTSLTKKFATESNLMYDVKLGVVYGEYQGYRVVIKYDESTRIFTVQFCAKPTSMQPYPEPSAFLTSLVDSKKYVKSADAMQYSLAIDVAFAMGKKNNQNLQEILDEVTDYLKRNLFVSCCAGCGEIEGISLYTINDRCAYLCDSCYQNKVSTLESEHIEAKQKKGNIVTGIVGAFLGSLIGVVVWVIVYQLGYIAAIAGLVTVVCAIKGYEMLGGKLNVLGLAICVLVSLGMIYIGHSLAYGLEIYIAFKDEGFGLTFFDAYRALPAFLSEYEDIRIAFIGELVMGYVMMVVGSVSYIISIYRKSNKVFKTKKVQ